MQTTSQDHRSERAQPEAVPGDRRHAKTVGGSSHPDIRIKRAYEPRDPHDGRRVLVDRLWPRGLSKRDLEDALWIRDVAPSADLRKWFGHRPERWAEFRRRYFIELQANPAVQTLRRLIAEEPVTLIYGARDRVHNQAVALAEYLGGQTQAEADQ